MQKTYTFFGFWKWYLLTLTFYLIDECTPLKILKQWMKTRKSFMKFGLEMEISWHRCVVWHSAKQGNIRQTKTSEYNKDGKVWFRLFRLWWKTGLCQTVWWTGLWGCVDKGFDRLGTDGLGCDGLGLGCYGLSYDGLGCNGLGCNGWDTIGKS